MATNNTLLLGYNISDSIRVTMQRHLGVTAGATKGVRVGVQVNKLKSPLRAFYTEITKELLTDLY